MYRAPQSIDDKDETRQQRMERLTGFDVYKCPFCKKGNLIDDEIIPRIRSPAKFLIKPKKLLVV